MGAFPMALVICRRSRGVSEADASFARAGFFLFFFSSNSKRARARVVDNRSRGAVSIAAATLCGMSSAVDKPHGSR